jgi:glycosyltransferase involved in cell wall biosynthesis/GT2 family glycosyltransferase
MGYTSFPGRSGIVSATFLTPFMVSTLSVSTQVFEIVSVSIPIRGNSFQKKTGTVIAKRTNGHCFAKTSTLSVLNWNGRQETNNHGDRWGGIQVMTTEPSGYGIRQRYRIQLSAALDRWISEARRSIEPAPSGGGSSRQEDEILTAIGTDRESVPDYLAHADWLLSGAHPKTAVIALSEAARFGDLPEKYRNIMASLKTEFPEFLQYQKRTGRAPIAEAKTPFRILVVTNLLPPQEMGGFGRTMWEFCRMLIRRGHSLRILTADMPHLHRDPGEDVRDVESRTRRALRLYGDWKNGRAVSEADDETILKTAAHNHRVILAEVAGFQPQACLVGNLDFLDYTFLDAVLEKGIPVIHRLGNRSPGYPVQATPTSDKYCLAGGSRWLNRKLRESGYQYAREAVIHPGSALETCYRYYPPVFNRLRICFAGLLMPYKGAQVLIKALGLLNRWGVPFECHIAGDSTHPAFVQELKRVAADGGFADRVTFTGFLSRNHLESLYSRVNVLVFPSIVEEVFGKSQIEAMAAGLAVISSGTGGAGEIISHGRNGLVLKENTPEELARQLRYLSDHPVIAAKLARNGQHDAFRYRTIDSVEKIEGLICRLAGEGGTEAEPSVYLSSSASNPTIEMLISLAKKSGNGKQIVAVHEPFVTIAIPTYNRGRYIFEAIESALTQSKAYSSFEVLVVDDGSEDDTRAIIGRFTSRRLRYRYKGHTGAPHTRNFAIGEAYGQYILWLDSDDVLMPDILARYAAFVERYPEVDVFYSDLHVTDADLNIIQTTHYQDWYRRKDELIAHQMVSNFLPNGGSLVKRDLYDRIGGFDEAFKRAHDYDFYSRAAGTAEFKKLDGVVMKYRLHDDNMSSPTMQFDTVFESRVAVNMLNRYRPEQLFPQLPWTSKPHDQCMAMVYLNVALRLKQLSQPKMALELVSKSFMHYQSRQALEMQAELEKMHAPVEEITLNI